MPDRKRTVRTGVKLAFSLAVILYLLLRVVPARDILASLRRVEIIWLVLSFSLHALGLVISAVRWQILFQAQGDKVPVGFLARSYLVGNFFNLFLPTRFGGDIVRIWDGSRYSRSLLKSSAVILVERFTGIIILLAFALIASLARIDTARRLPLIWVSLLVGACGLAFCILFLLPSGRFLIEWIPGRGILAKARARIKEFREVILVYRKEWPSFLKALCWAFLLQVNVILHYYLAGKAFHLAIPLLDYFFFIPIVLIILTIPVTISGLGLREFLYIEIFAAYGIAGHVAFSFSLIADILFTLIIGLAGGILYMLRRQ